MRHIHDRRYGVIVVDEGELVRRLYKSLWKLCTAFQCERFLWVCDADTLGAAEHFAVFHDGLQIAEVDLLKERLEGNELHMRYFVRSTHMKAPQDGVYRVPANLLLDRHAHTCGKCSGAQKHQLASLQIGEGD